MVGPVERNVNVVQEVVESVGSRVGRIIRIITRTVGEVAREVSGVVADGFDIAEAAKKARADHERWDAGNLTADDVDEAKGDDVGLEDEAADDDALDLDDEAADDDEVVSTVDEVTSDSEAQDKADAPDLSEQERV